MSIGTRPVATNNSLAGMVARCAHCDERTFLLPLYGARGGPLCCPLCIGKFHAEHGKRRRHGRIVIRAMRAFLANGGRPDDIDKLKQTVICGDFFGHDVLGHDAFTDPLGYLAHTANTKGEVIELTSELLADAIRLAHPDYHPPERQDLARRTTQGLLALQPFTFPAPKPKPPPKPVSEANDDELSKAIRKITDRPRTTESTYPCADCRGTVPADYCESLQRRMGQAPGEGARARSRQATKVVCQPQGTDLEIKSLR